MTTVVVKLLPPPAGDGLQIVGHLPVGAPLRQEVHENGHVRLIEILVGAKHQVIDDLADARRSARGQSKEVVLGSAEELRDPVEDRLRA